MQMIALINQKSEMGKTTCAINTKAGLKKLNKCILLINLKSLFGIFRFQQMLINSSNF